MPKIPGPIFSAVDVVLLGRSPEPAEVPVVLLARVAQHVELLCAVKTRRELYCWFAI